MGQFLIVGLGGFMGAVARYKLGGFVLHHTVGNKFPMSTLAVNVLGCCIAGLLTGLIERHDFFSPLTRLLLFTGFLGGFTTFSAFGLETFYLIQRHEFLLAGLNAFLSVSLGLFALWLGIRMGGITFAK